MNDKIEVYVSFILYVLSSKTHWCEADSGSFENVELMTEPDDCAYVKFKFSPITSEFLTFVI
jgi:hypothetical protein